MAALNGPAREMERHCVIPESAGMVVSRVFFHNGGGVNGKSRSSKWRNERISKGAKAVGVTLDPEAAKSLEILQETFNWSQREAISFALDFAASHKDQIDVSRHFQKVFLETFNPKDLLDKMARLERRTQTLESELGALREHVESSEASLRAAVRDREEAAFAGETAVHEPGRPDEAGEWEPLLHFTAKLMLEHGERMTKSRLFEMARHERIPIHPTQHEFSSYLSRNMNRVRDIMRQLKEGGV